MAKPGGGVTAELPAQPAQFLSLAKAKQSDHHHIQLRTRQGGFFGETQPPADPKIQYKIACVEGNVLLARLALPNIADKNMPLDDQGNTGLILAVGGYYYSLIRVLLTQGSDPNARNLDGVTAFYRANLQGQPDTVLLLLSTKRISYETLHGATKHGYTPFMAACKSRDIRCARILVDNGVDVNATIAELPSGDPPVTFFARLDNASAMCVALMAGADPSVPSKDSGDTALSVAKPGCLALLRTVPRIVQLSVRIFCMILASVRTAMTDTTGRPGKTAMPLLPPEIWSYVMATFLLESNFCDPSPVNRVAALLTQHRPSGHK